MNVMLTCVGRRNYLVEYFKQAISPDGKVIGVNSIPYTSGMMAADISIISPPVNSEKYIDFLIDASLKYDVNAIFSLFDIDLKFLSKAKKRFEDKNIRLVISDEKVIDICNDKYQTYLWLMENQLCVPKTYLKINDVLHDLNLKLLTFPLIIKPRYGMGSISVFKADNIEELQFFYNFAEKQIHNSYLFMLSDEYKNLDSAILIQEMIDGDEYGIDVLNNISKKYIISTVKKKLAMRSGETDSAEIVKNQQLEELGKVISNKLKHIGNLDLDVIISKNGMPYVIDMNPRFGGGYPFTHEFGNNYIKYLINDILNNENNIEFNVFSNKYIGCKGIKLYGGFF
jgi:carbamoyl-phosphate synthase large subunit